MVISRLTKVPLRELWKHEARGFTNWLADHLDYLSEALGFRLTLDQKEIAAGTFSADIRVEDSQGNYVIIENQLEKTDHDHLGKLITYMSNLEAKVAIWITSEPRPEHERAVQWLNETLPADTAFYLVKVEAYRIDSSAPAPLFTIVAGPTAVSRQVGEEKKELAERHIERLEFWKQLLEKHKQRGAFFAHISPTTQNWIQTATGKGGINFAHVIMMNGWRVEVYIGTNDKETNKRYFDQLFARKEFIEQTFGKPLEWQRLDDRSGCRIGFSMQGKGLNDKGQWQEVQERMIEEMYTLRNAIQKEIDKLNLY
jgi:hypothetical protein